MEVFNEIRDAVIAGSFDKVTELTRKALDSGLSANDVINNGLIAGMNVVGPRFKAGEMFVPEVLMCACAMKEGMKICESCKNDADDLSEGKIAGKIVIGTVEGDLHDIGKNIVAMMMETSGFKVIDIGIDVAVERFVEAVKEHKPQVLGMSALLTTTMPSMDEVIDALKEEGLRNNIKVIIGGAPVTQEYSDAIGADGYAPDAASATELVQELLCSVS